MFISSLVGRELKRGTASKGTRGKVWKLKGWRPDKEEMVEMARTGWVWNYSGA